MGVIIRQSIKGTIVNYIGVFIGFVTTMFVATRFLSQEVLGLTTVLMSAGLLLSSFAQLGISFSAMRFFPYFKDRDGKQGNHNGFFYYLVTIPFVGILIYVPLYLILKQPISAYFEQNSALFVDYFYWIIPFACFLLYGIIFETYSTLLLRITVPKIIKEIISRILLILLYVSYGLGFIGIDAFVACYIGIYGIVMVLTFFYVKHIGPVSLKHDPLFLSKPLKKDFLSYTGILLVGSFGGKLVSSMDIFMVTSHIGLASTAIYTIAMNMAATIEIPSRSIIAISSPLASDALQAGRFDEANELYKKVSLHQLLVGSLIFLLLWINMDNIYAIIPNGDIYEAGKWVFLFISLSKLIEVTLNFGSNLISYSKYYQWGMYFVFFITGLTICLNNVLIPIWGITGAAIATMLTNIVSYGIWQWVLFVKIKANPYTLGIVKQIVIVLFLLGVNACLPVCANPWLDGICRTPFIAAIALVLIYLGKVSDEINQMVNNVLHGIWKR